MTNPLLLSSKLPEFSKIKLEHLKPALNEKISNCRQLLNTVKRIAHSDLTWNDTVAEIVTVESELSYVWSIISHLNSVMNTDEWQAAHDELEQVLTEFYTEVGQDQELYEMYKQLNQYPQNSKLTPEQQRVVELELIGFRLSGIGLDDSKRSDLKKLFAKSSELESSFANNALKATQSWSMHVVEDEFYKIKNLPEADLEIARQKANKKDLDGYLFTLDAPSYVALITYADDRDIREKIYKAYVTKASNLAENTEYDNANNITDILQTRHKIATTLDYKSYSEYALEKNMASSPTEVLGFLRGLLIKAKDKAKEQLNTLKDFAKSKGCSDMKSWDVAYYSEKLKEQEYSYSEQEVKEYFVEDKVFDALFGLLDKLFGLKVRQVIDADVWQKDVKLYEIVAPDNSIVGMFYTDLYARDNKRSGAWMDDLRTRMTYKDGSSQVPVTYLVTNFSGPTEKTPSLLSHSDVLTVYHEFGHTIHHLLSKCKEYSVSGIHGVSWDAVELPSQFWENWAWQWEVIQDMSSHYKTGKKMPKSLFDKMYKAKTFQAAMFLCRQLEFAIFDETIHNGQVLDSDAAHAELVSLRKEIGLLQPPEYNRFQNTFTHIFAGGYSANYYSYLWAEMLSTDAFSKFEEDGLYNEDTAKSFLTNILEKGGSEPMETLYKKFRGSEPKIDALLVEYGIS